MVLSFQPKRQKRDTDKPDRKYTIKEIKLHNNTIIGIFEGDGGYIKENDIVIKYQEQGKRLRTPKHIHWVIDLLIKKNIIEILLLNL